MENFMNLLKKFCEYPPRFLRQIGQFNSHINPVVTDRLKRKMAGPGLFFITKFGYIPNDY
jgi:hypothetical protein